jgi:hypothetical protein
LKCIISSVLSLVLYSSQGHTVTWLRHYATSWKVEVSSSDEVDFFNLPNPSSRTIALGSTQPLNRNEYQESSWGVKGGRRVRLTSSPPSVSQLSRENVGPSTSHYPMGLHGMLRDIFTFFLLYFSLLHNLLTFLF